MSIRVAFYTLGCKVNQYDTLAMSELLEGAGYAIVDWDSEADVRIVNTCTVTGIADKKSRQMIRRADARVVGVSGCLSQRDAREALAIDGVSFAVGTAGRASLPEIIERALSGERSIDATGPIGSEYEELPVSKSSERTRAHIKICDGCNSFCAYCIIPYTRGRVRSRRPEYIAAEAGRLAMAGTKEIVLTGIHISSYGQDLDGASLPELLGELDSIPGIERIRLGSLEPTLLTEDFCRGAADIKKLCPHFHVSLQSGSEAVLARMNRHYTPAEYAAFVSNLRRAFHKPAITTDIIAGFPGETEGEHTETVEFVKSMAFSRIHVFPFSERRGTKAANMTGKLPANVKKQRAAELIAIGDELEAAYTRSLAGTEQHILLEEPLENGLWEGYTERYVRASAAGHRGEIVPIRF